MYTANEVLVEESKIITQYLIKTLKLWEFRDKARDRYYRNSKKHG